MVYHRDGVIFRNMRCKQKMIIADTVHLTSTFIKQLHCTHSSHLNVTMLQFLMSMRHTDRKDKPLFYSIKQAYPKHPVIFHCNKNAYQQANKLLATLLQVIEGIMGKKVLAKHWLKAEAWQAVQKFKMERIDPTDPFKGVKISSNKAKEESDTDSKFWRRRV